MRSSLSDGHSRCDMCSFATSGLTDVFGIKSRLDNVTFFGRPPDFEDSLRGRKGAALLFENKCKGNFIRAPQSAIL